MSGIETLEEEREVYDDEDGILLTTSKQLKCLKFSYR